MNNIPADILQILIEDNAIDENGKITLGAFLDAKEKARIRRMLRLRATALEEMINKYYGRVNKTDQ